MSLISAAFCRRTVATCALLAVMPSWAAVTTTATVGPMTVQVFDMRSEDAMAASVSFANQAFGANVTANAWEAWPSDDLRHSKSGSWQGTSVDAATARTEAHAAITGGASTSPLGAMMQLSGSVHDFSGPANPGAEYSAQAAMQANGQMLSFALTPWSAMTLSFDVSGALATVRPGDRAEIIFELSLNTSTGMERFDTFSMACIDACSDTNGRVLSVSLANESNSTLDGLWTLNARVAGASFATPVPEPSSGVLLMSGVAVLGLMARRRLR